MVNSDWGRTLAAIVCTVVFSATCVLSAVAPAQAGAASARVTTARLAA